MDSRTSPLVWPRYSITIGCLSDFSNGMVEIATFIRLPVRVRYWETEYYLSQMRQSIGVTTGQLPDQTNINECLKRIEKNIADTINVYQTNHDNCIHQNVDEKPGFREKDEYQG